MKKIVKRFVSLALTAAVLLSLSSCTFFRNMREYMENARNVALLPTPADDELPDVYRAALETSVRECTKIDENTSLSVNDIEVSDGAGDRDIGLLRDSAKQLAAFIMRNHPGSASKEYTAANAQSSLLYAVLSGQFIQTASERDIAVVPVTDEKGNAVTDENGEPVNEETFAGNDLRIFFRMYEQTPAADGEEEAPETRVIADAAAIEAVFGPAREKAAVLEACASVKDYLQVTDYTFEYRDCFVKAALDMETNRIPDVTFEKNLAVTAEITGAGPLADYGAFTVTFTLNEKTAYTFQYPEEN